MWPELLIKLAFSQQYQKEENEDEEEQMIKYSSSVRHTHFMVVNFSEFINRFENRGGSRI